MKTKFSILTYWTCLIIFATLLISCSDEESFLGDKEVYPTVNNEILILVSFDGFRHDYIHAAHTPALDQLAASGVISEGLIPVFPSKTFPNHFTQVTGLYAENHGIVSNTMYDPVMDEMFSIGTTSASDGAWYEGEPIWVTAEKQGLKAATYFWPGSDAEIKGVRPTYYFEFEGTVPYWQRTAQILSWLSLPPDQRPDFMTLYFQSPDPEGHESGPLSESVISACEEVDRQLGDLMEGIDNLDLSDSVNLIVVSDHGMAEINRDSMIFLDDYINLNDVYMVNWSPVADMIPNDGKEEQIYQSLVDAHPKLRVYRKEEIPSRYHYRDHRRITPIVCIAEKGWSISDRTYFQRNPDLYLGGAHGYDPSDKSMWGIFVASGPSFKKNLEIPAFESVHLYEMMCRILNITPAPNDGDFDVFIEILRR